MENITINASKQECQKAIEAFARINRIDMAGTVEDFKQVEDFLNVALRKLPNETSFPTSSEERKAVEEAVRKGFEIDTKGKKE